MNAVFMSGPPKQMLVVIGSGIGWCSTCLPSGELTVTTPLISVATEIGEVDAALLVDHEVVRPAQRVAGALAVQHLDGAGREIDPLQAAAAVVACLHQRPDAALFAVPLEAAIVGDIGFAVGTDRGAV